MGSEGSTSPIGGGGCAVCGGAAAVYCVADAAALCVPCDAAIHAANALASRHERVPLAMAAAAASSGVYDGLFAAADDDGCGSAVSSWMVPAQGSPNYSSSSFSASDSSGGERSLFDLLSDVDIMASCAAGGGFGVCHMAAIGDLATHGAAPLWMHPGLGASANGALTSWSPPTTTAVLAAAADREARVMRYREKRKNRRFQKTIRYASRKAYAEARPRIKGRFVKRATASSSSSSSAAASDDDGTAAAAADTTACQAMDGADAAKFWLSFSDEKGFYMDPAAAYGVVPTF